MYDGRMLNKSIYGTKLNIKQSERLADGLAYIDAPNMSKKTLSKIKRVQCVKEPKLYQAPFTEKVIMK